MRFHHTPIAITLAGFLRGQATRSQHSRQHPVAPGKALSIALFETIRAANDSGIRQFTTAKFSRKTRTVSWQGLTRCGSQ